MSSPSSPSKKRRWRWGGAWLIGLAVSIALLIWVLHRINFRDVWADARQADGLLLAITVIVATITFPVRTFRWQLILRDANGGRLPWAPLWHATTIGFMANNLLPARAGEFARAYVAARQLPGVRFSTALASLGVERVLDGLVMLGLMAAAIAAPSFPAHARVGGRSVSAITTSAAVLFGILFLIALTVVFRPAPWLRLFERISKRLLPERVARRFGHFVEGMVAGLVVLKSPGRLTGALVWSVVLWLKNAAAFAICFKAFGIEIPLEAALVLQAIIGFGVAIPSSPSGVGVFEAATLVTLQLYGVDSNLAVSYALTYHLTTFLPITLLGFWSLSRLHLRLGELRAEPDAA